MLYIIFRWKCKISYDVLEKQIRALPEEALEEVSIRQNKLLIFHLLIIFLALCLMKKQMNFVLVVDLFFQVGKLRVLYGGCEFAYSFVLYLKFDEDF